MSEPIQIVNGPDLMKMIFSLAEGNPTPRKTVTFINGAGTEFVLAITAMAQEDGSGNRWTFNGYGGAGRFRGEMRGYFDTQTRKGWLEWSTRPL